MNKFDYNHKPTEQMLGSMEFFRRAFKALNNNINQTVTPSRELSLAITNLEQANFWLNKAITHTPDKPTLTEDNQEKE